MAKISFADIQKSADAKNEGLLIEGVPGGDVRLLSPLRLSPERRETLIKSVSDAGDLGDMSEPGAVDKAMAAVEKVLRTAAEDAAGGNRLVKAMGGDIALLTEMANEYVGAVQLGEASPSSS